MRNQRSWSGVSLLQKEIKTNTDLWKEAHFWQQAWISWLTANAKVQTGYFMLAKGNPNNSCRSIKAQASKNSMKELDWKQQ